MYLKTYVCKKGYMGYTVLQSFLSKYLYTNQSAKKNIVSK